MDIKSVLLDVIKHTNGLGIIENIKVTGTDSGTELAAMDPDKTVIMTAKLHGPVPEFEGEFGMGSLGLLSSLTRLSNYQDPSATIEVKREERNGEELPTTLLFKDTDGGKDQYRFMSKKVVDDVMKVATFKGAAWQVEIQPAQKRVAQLAEVAGIYSGIDPAFSVKTEDDKLIFEVGSTEGGVIGRRVFAENVGGTLGTTWRWPLSQFLSILKLGGTQVVRFSDQGACEIEVDSGLGIYKYIMPAMSGS